jgi:hypothetical protein
VIVKQSTKALDMEEVAHLFAEGALKHLTHRERSNLLKEKRGMDGERKVAHILDRHFHQSDDHAVIHDLRIEDGIGSYAQFDHVILSRLSRTATIIEVKNYGGTLSKNDHGEWIVWYKSKRRPQDIPSPTKQAQRQMSVLKAWLKSKNHDLAFGKVGWFVVVPSDCSIDRSKVMAEDFVLKADNLIEKWVEFGGISQLGRLFSAGVSTGSLRAIGVQLSAAHCPGTTSVHDRVRKAAELLDADEVQSSEIEAEDGGEIYISESPSLPDPGAVNAGQTSGNGNAVEKRSSPIEVAPGIYEQEIGDGGISFFSAKNDEVAKERLEQVCLGKAQWNRRTQRWICDDDRALEIKEVFVGTLPYVQSAQNAQIVIEPGKGGALSRLPSKIGNGEALATPGSKKTRKAGDLIEISSGISKRTLPDGRVAFLAAKGDLVAIERVRNACKGRGQWKPLFGNWVCDGDVALLVERIIAEPEGKAL